ncbi:hypothetical protein CCO03_18365 [Comamonas serinivorans]|uniref:YiaAB two helix domain-containing protein n=2 Tax=Comamonas serinivorans TaxID=1082851 RepID=A0A1Y0EU07_9BURK|nr:hypothetical protein CCO03_18365 [Comamonas serinivorans]
MQPLIRRDTSAWQGQVWASFGAALLLCTIGLWNLPGQNMDRAFMVLGYFFCLSSGFVLAKFIRDAEAAKFDGREADTPLFLMVVWGGFGGAMLLTAWGLYRMNLDITYKGYLGVCWLYLISCTFTLAKMLRDRHEADLAEARALGTVSIRRDSRATAGTSTDGDRPEATARNG